MKRKHPRDRIIIRIMLLILYFLTLTQFPTYCCSSPRSIISCCFI